MRTFQEMVAGFAIIKHLTAINMLKMRNLGISIPDDVYEFVINSLEKLEQYRAIGTVEEIEPYVRLGEKLNLCDLVRENARLTRKIQFLEIYEKELKIYKEIGTVEECRKAMERKKAKKPIKDEYNHDCCPDCGWIVYQDEWGGRYLPHCENCGQAISWEEEEKCQ